MDEDEDVELDDDEVAELEAEDLTDKELADIKRSQQDPETPDPNDQEVS